MNCRSLSGPWGLVLDPYPNWRAVWHVPPPCRRILYTTAGLTNRTKESIQSGNGVVLSQWSQRPTGKGHCETRNTLQHLKWLLGCSWWVKLVFEYPKGNHTWLLNPFKRPTWGDHQPWVHRVLKETHCFQCYLQLWKTLLCVLSEECNLHFLASYAAYRPVFLRRVSFRCSVVRSALFKTSGSTPEKKYHMFYPLHWARQNSEMGC